MRSREGVADTSASPNDRGLDAAEQTAEAGLAFCPIQQAHAGDALLALAQAQIAGGAAATAVEETLSRARAPESTVLPEGDLVKTKRFEMKPMTVENAALQMQLLGHRFFMFFNSESDCHNVLYQRDDGDFGLIQPEE